MGRSSYIWADHWPPNITEILKSSFIPLVGMEEFGGVNFYLHSHRIRFHGKQIIQKVSYQFNTEVIVRDINITKI